MSLRTVRRPAADIPVMLETEVLVCGGGPAGTAAAIAAARRGAKVTLIERYNHLGGLATGGLVVVLPHFVDDDRQTIGGIGLELREAMKETGEAWSHSSANDSVYFDPEALKAFSLKLCVEAGVEILHHCWLSDAIVEDGRVRGVIFESKAGTQAALANLVIDATGDGDIFAWAGAQFEKSDQGIGLPFRVGGLDVDRWQAWVAENQQASGDFWKSLKEEIKWPHAHLYVAGMNREQGTAWGNNYYMEADGLDPRVLSEIEVGGRLKIRHALEILRKGLPGWEKAWLIDTASQLGVRRSRRLTGLYQITGPQTAMVDWRHPDAIGRGNDFRRQGLVYDLPYGSLVPVKLDGLLTCGRCLSCDHEALEPIREIHVCWVSGEGAGAAAALALQAGIQPREVDVPKLQETLRAANVAFAQDYVAPA